jgi:hypothetical protein
MTTDWNEDDAPPGARPGGPERARVRRARWT